MDTLMSRFAIVCLAGISAYSGQFSAAQDAARNTGSTPVVVVELFTSQGCSSCPPADANLVRLTQVAAGRNLPIHTLSFHVDYWNRLGWTDPYSSSLASRRQREYAQRTGSSQVYTPQMIVNGTVEFVGSNSRKADTALQTALKQPQTTSITAKAVAVGRNVTVMWEAVSVSAGDVINVAVVQDSTENSVPRGENAGRELRHANVVRDFATISNPGSTGTSTLQLPADLQAKGSHVIVYIQSSATGQIHGAAQTPVI